MRIRTILIFAFLIATLVPSATFGWLSFQNNAAREFSEVKDQHLLHAQNASKALERYHVDLMGTFKSISDALLMGLQTPNLEALMTSINMSCVLIVDASSGVILARTDVGPAGVKTVVPQQFLNAARNTQTKNSETRFSTVIGSRRYGNVILGVRGYGDKLALAVVTTEYFGELSNSISFGKKGHAAIVDRAGNVLAHPRPEWVSERKNLAQVSAVSRMMNGETGIERFFSPALGKDMIAGLATVPGAGWGVMIPQPVQELYDKAYQDTKTIFVVLAVGLVLTMLFVAVLLNSLAFPIEHLLRSVKKNAEQMRLTRNVARQGIIPLTEISQFSHDYNHMVDRVSDANMKIASLAFNDLVTGLPNRARLRGFANRVIDKKAGAVKGALIFVDLDDFKQINDVYGHAVGDQFLLECAKKLKRVVAQELEYFSRPAETDEPPLIARVGGDEFAIVFPGMINTRSIRAFLGRLQAELSRPSEQLEYITKWGASLGCARFPMDADNLEDLTKFADIAMYQAKKNGKNRFQIYNRDIGTQTASELVAEVEKAIHNDELVLEYQPKIRSKDQRVVGVEALVRWIHPTKGRIPPDKWISTIGDSTAIIELGEWVVAKAMDDHLNWRKEGLFMDVAVNIGSKHFSHPDFAKNLLAVAQKKNFDTKRMEIEITEDALFSTPKDAAAAIRQLAGHGFQVAIDDFGSGYSNFTRLSELSVDTLKIDRSLVSSSRHNERVRSMLDCIVVMAKTLGCQAIAEGVESAEDVERMSKTGIDVVQGFHFSRSMAAATIPVWIKHFERDSRSRPAAISKRSVAA